MGKTRNRRESVVFRTQCEAYLLEGLSISKIAKLTDKSYSHTKQICLQIKADMEQTNDNTR
jgi:transposase